MIKKIFLIIGAAFLMLVGGSALNSVSANTTTVKVEVVSRNIEKHTINVKTDDNNEDKFTLKKVSKAQMTAANKGEVFKVTYDDDFNLKALEEASKVSGFKHLLNFIAFMIVWVFFVIVLTLIILVFG